MEPAFRAQYSEVKERTLATGLLLPGTPGSLALRRGTGYAYWYRDHYAAPGKRVDELVCKGGEEDKLRQMRKRVVFAQWVAEQVPKLRKLGFQVADKATARVLVELHNQGAFDAGLMLTGSLAFMAWLNELGAIAASARTRDVDLARPRALSLAARLPFLPLLASTGLPFTAIRAMPSTGPSTSAKLAGAQGLRVELLAPGRTVGAQVRVPELDWAVQSVPHYDYLLDKPESGASLAGWHCIPVRLPQAARRVWHKIYSSQKRRGFPEKAAKDLHQAAVLSAALMESEPMALERAAKQAPSSMLSDCRAALPVFGSKLENHPQLLELVRSARSGAPRRSRSSRSSRR
jgi:hypothetical protein